MALHHYLTLQYTPDPLTIHQGIPMPRALLVVEARASESLVVVAIGV
jgi:hypothetical protein